MHKQSIRSYGKGLWQQRRKQTEWKGNQEPQKGREKCERLACTVCWYNLSFMDYFCLSLIQQLEQKVKGMTAALEKRMQGLMAEVQVNSLVYGEGLGNTWRRLGKNQSLVV